MTINESEWVWIVHPDLGRPARVHVDAAEAWRGRGWVDTDPPAEPNTVIEDPTLWGEPAAQDAKADEPAAADQAAAAAEQTETNRSRRSSAAPRGE